MDPLEHHHQVELISLSSVPFGNIPALSLNVVGISEGLNMGLI